MSYVPNRAMKHAHAEIPSAEPTLAEKARDAVEHVHPPMWTMIAAGVGGAVATALLLSLRSSTPAKPPVKRPGRPRKAAGATKKSA